MFKIGEDVRIKTNYLDLGDTQVGALVKIIDTEIGSVFAVYNKEWGISMKDTPFYELIKTVCRDEFFEIPGLIYMPMKAIEKVESDKVKLIKELPKKSMVKLRSPKKGFVKYVMANEVDGDIVNAFSPIIGDVKIRVDEIEKVIITGEELTDEEFEELEAQVLTEAIIVFTK